MGDNEKISVHMEITNIDDIVATAKRLNAIANELLKLGWQLRVKTELKGKGASSFNLADCTSVLDED